LDIPPDSNWVEWGGPAGRIRQNANFTLLESNPETPLADALIDMIVQEENVSTAQVRMVLDERLGRKHIPQPASDAADDIQAGEWFALTSPVEKYDPRDNFIAKDVSFPDPSGHAELQSVADELHRLIGQIVLVNRLREVRVLQGFQRHTMDRIVAPDLGKREKFLPAIEVFGEGVFIRLGETALSEWEEGEDVRRRTDILRQRLAGSMHARWLDDEITPRLVLLHTFAHVVMRAMAFEAGYSSSSLRERIYSSTGENPQAGVLVYTAAGDSEGTMGGLARLGQADRLVPILASALAAAQWCSLDPVCAESNAQGVDGLSLAACHACALVSETSCVLGNVMLDRMMLVDPGFGYLSTVVGALIDTQAEIID
jgi:AraC-like DNA-binding protein